MPLSILHQTPKKKMNTACKKDTTKTSILDISMYWGEDDCTLATTPMYSNTLANCWL